MKLAFGRRQRFFRALGVRGFAMVCTLVSNRLEHAYPHLQQKLVKGNSTN